MQETTNAYPARYEIWIAACKDHSVIQGCRPVIVIGTDEDLITVVPLSPQLTYPQKHTHTLISGQGLDVTSRTISNAPDGRGLFRGISGNFTRFSQIVEEFIDNAVADYLAHLEKEIVPCIDIGLEQNGDYIVVTIRDDGSGIADLDAALTIGGPVQVKSPLHEHSMGLKHALASASTDEEQQWSIQTRTAEDAAADR